MMEQEVKAEVGLTFSMPLSKNKKDIEQGTLALFEFIISNLNNYLVHELNKYKNTEIITKYLTEAKVISVKEEKEIYKL